MIKKRSYRKEPVRSWHTAPPAEAHGEKRWQHYLFDFFMLFLAVTAGFFVDNLREHYVEVQREKQFIHSMVDDLRGDIHKMDSVLNRRLVRQRMIDSCLFILALPDPDQYGADLYYYARWLPRVTKIYTNDGTLIQLKNAGNLRLIRSQPVRDAIMAYDQQIRFWSTLEDREEALVQAFYPSLKTMFDARVFEQMVDSSVINRPSGQPRLLLKDAPHINELYSHIHFLKNVNTYQMQFGRGRVQEAQELLALLKKEYGDQF